MNNMEHDFFELDNKRLINLALLCILILSIFFLISLYASRGIRNDQNIRYAQEQKVNPFQDLSIEGLSAIVYDINTGKTLYEKNSTEVRPLASITKILSAVTAIDLLPQGTIVTVDKAFLKEEGDSGLYSNEKWKLKDLIDYTLISSSNDGMAAIAGAAGALDSGSKNFDISKQDFITKMNAKANEIGMTQSRFYNETGLDVNQNDSGGYSSASDVAKLFAYTLKNHPEVFDATKLDKIAITSQSNISHKAENTNTFINSIPGLIASKTGYTDLAQGNLAVIIDPGVARPIAIVVLGSSIEGRFTDVQTLVQKTYQYLSQGN